MDDAFTQAMLAVNANSAFNQNHGFAIKELASGSATIAFGVTLSAANHAGTLHAGVTAGVLDTVSGYAAATVAGAVVTVGLNVSYISASAGPDFEARAVVIRSGRTQVFVDARLFQVGEPEKLIATASVILTRIAR